MRILLFCCPIIALKQFWQVFLSNSNALVSKTYRCESVYRYTGNVDFGVRRRVFDGIANKIVDHLTNFIPVGNYPRSCTGANIQLGPYNGLNLCKELKASSLTHHITVIMVSGHEIIHFAKHYDANDILLKLFNLDALMQKVDSFLSAKIISF